MDNEVGCMSDKKKGEPSTRFPLTFSVYKAESRYNYNSDTKCSRQDGAREQIMTRLHHFDPCTQQQVRNQLPLPEIQ
ncbi:hypothetical protein MTR67_023326 [Solanum verrucosum]|uniref:Uncharacterized protein n=1 Tax=Solanum verrucosum TaxID=315347 RepID=A0AAF0QUZ9_SOLVR|nr:hypothetical protein MTR67_023326 [Solanum verrucosum]